MYTYVYTGYVHVYVYTGHTRLTVTALTPQPPPNQTKQSGHKDAERAGVEAEREALIAQREAAANEAAQLQERLDGEGAKQEELREKLKGVDKEVGGCLCVWCVVRSFLSWL